MDYPYQSVHGHVPNFRDRIPRGSEHAPFPIPGHVSSTERLESLGKPWQALQDGSGIVQCNTSHEPEYSRN